MSRWTNKNRYTYYVSLGYPFAESPYLIRVDNSNGRIEISNTKREGYWIQLKTLMLLNKNRQITQIQAETFWPQLTT